MRLFGEVSGSINHRDAAMWLCSPFDLDIRDIQYPSSKTVTKVGPSSASFSTVGFTGTMSMGMSGSITVPTSN